MRGDGADTATDGGDQVPNEYRVNMTELARITGKSLPTLRTLINDNPDFPILERGANGVAYEFDVRAVSTWFDEHKRQQAEAEAARRQELAKLQADFFGEAGEEETRSLTPAERSALAEAKFKENRLSEQQGRLVPRDEVEAAFEAVFREIRRTLQPIGGEIQKSNGLDRATRVKIDNTVKAALANAARKVRGLAEGDDDARAA